MSENYKVIIGNPVFNKNNYQNILHPIYNIRQFCKDIKYSIQRINRGYSDYDVLDIDDWFINTVPNMLESYLFFNDSLKSFPGVFQEEVFEEHKDEIGCTYEEYLKNYDGDFEDFHDRLEHEAIEKWRGIIKKMIFLFKESDSSYSEKQNSYGMASNNYLKAENELNEYREKCKNQAFELFSKYFRNLWE